MSKLTLDDKHRKYTTNKRITYGNTNAEKEDEKNIAKNASARGGEMKPEEENICA